MSRLIDADALIDDIQRYANEPIKLNDRRWDTKCVAIIQDMIGTVKLHPTIEAEPVVRCKGCKFYPDGEGTTKWVPCRVIITPPNWFCADGQRKDGGDA